MFRPMTLPIVGITIIAGAIVSSQAGPPMRAAALEGEIRSHAAAVPVLAHVPAADDAHPQPLAIGSPAPDFNLPAIDGKTYSLASFRDSKTLVVIFTAVHCPTAEIYESRIKQLVADYRGRGVAFAVIQPNSAKALRLD